LGLKGDLDRAIAEYYEAIGLNPESAPAYLARGVASEIKHGLQEALADFKMYCELAPSDPKGSGGSGARTVEIERTMTGGAERPFARIWHIAAGFPRPAAITSGFLHHFYRVTAGQAGQPSCLFVTR